MAAWLPCNPIAKYHGDIKLNSTDWISMAGLTPTSPRPTEIKLHQKSRELEIHFDDSAEFRFSCEFLRVYSPSAEVRGHGPGQEVLQVGKKNIDITAIDPVGSYAVKLVFSDGHDTGLYSWDYFYDLGKNQENYWKTYLARMEQSGASREQATNFGVTKLK
jgi:DUF971 family protein